MANNNLTLYRFGGYILTSGKFDDGNKWTGMRLLLAKVPNPDTDPVTAKSVKCDRTLMDFVQELAIGQLCDVYFDENGKVVAMDCSAYVG